MKDRVLVFAVALGVVSGCSFILVKAPSMTSQQAQRPDCTTSYSAPIVDTVVVGTAGLAVAWGAAQGGPALRGPNDFANLAPNIALWTGLATMAVSAVYGYVEVHRCRAVWSTPAMPPPVPPAPE
jgi:hypothetical protein